MAKIREYIFNASTLSYEEAKDSKMSHLWRSIGLFIASIACFCLYFWLYASVLGLELPKTLLLKKENARWTSKVEVMNRQLDNYSEILTALQMRDDDIYRSIFGMNDISQSVREAGFGGVNRYAALEDDPVLKNTMRRLDKLTKKAYVQSKSFDDVALLSKRAGDMASCIPAIPPINPDPKKYRISSTFGYRSDPISHRTTKHNGIDFAMKPGNPVYTTGDGVVESVKFELFGYGNSIIIDHGFGYKTRYAHMKSIVVTEGMSLKRGECIGYSGNSGKSTGAHLHYEVLYRGNDVNPYNYFDLSITPEEYATMVQITQAASEKITLHPSHKKR